MLVVKVIYSVLALGAVTLAIPVTQLPQLKRQDTVCGYGIEGIKKPLNNATITYPENSDGDPFNFEVIYCSGQYFKTSSLSASLLLSNPANGDNSLNSGMILVNNASPDNQDAPAGFYSYRLNVTMYPIDG